MYLHFPLVRLCVVAQASSECDSLNHLGGLGTDQLIAQINHDYADRQRCKQSKLNRTARKSIGMACEFLAHLRRIKTNFLSIGATPGRPHGNRNFGGKFRTKKVT